MLFYRIDQRAGFANDIAVAQENWKGTENGALLTDHAASYIAGIAMEGASDTASNTLQGFVKVSLILPTQNSYLNSKCEGNASVP